VFSPFGHALLSLVVVPPLSFSPDGSGRFIASVRWREMVE
jgi:hypothetical protein